MDREEGHQADCESDCQRENRGHYCDNDDVARGVFIAKETFSTGRVGAPIRKVNRIGASHASGEEVSLEVVHRGIVLAKSKVKRNDLDNDSEDVYGLRCDKH